MRVCICITTRMVLIDSIGYTMYRQSTPLDIVTLGVETALLTKIGACIILLVILLAPTRFTEREHLV